jgi:6-phosphogluconate dehydrogenase
MMKNKIGVYGLGVMGRNLALNLASKGHRVSLYNRETEWVDHVIGDAKKEAIDTLDGYDTVEDFMKSLAPPKKVIVMVTAGKPVDYVMESMLPYLQQGDIVIDGGNEWYENTERRQKWLWDACGTYVIGMGVSGGKHGARYGASLMPGGDVYAYDIIRPFLNDMAAKLDNDDDTCQAYIGAGGCGNYVKMVHNGIEYGIMQIIAEVYDILRTCFGYTNEETAQWFDETNETMNSYLIDITARVLRQKEGERDFVDIIEDVPQMNGTGTWTARESFSTQPPVAIPIITTAMQARCIQANKKTRVALNTIASRGKKENDIIQRVCTVEDVRRAMKMAMYFCYLQGFELIQAKSTERKWGVDIPQLAHIWLNGCIIRSDILHFFESEREEGYMGYMTRMFADMSMYRLCLVNTLQVCLELGIATPVLSACHQYILAMTQEKSVGNIIQAQRNYFGGHPIKMSRK